MRAGANICPQSAVALKCVMQAREEGVVKEQDLVVSVSTASGIKFTDAGIKFHKSGDAKHYVNMYRIVEGSLHALEESLGGG